MNDSLNHFLNLADFHRLIDDKSWVVKACLRGSDGAPFGRNCEAGRGRIYRVRVAVAAGFCYRKCAAGNQLIHRRVGSVFHVICALSLRDHIEIHFDAGGDDGVSRKGAGAAGGGMFQKDVVSAQAQTGSQEDAQENSHNMKIVAPGLGWRKVPRGERAQLWNSRGIRGLNTFAMCDLRIKDFWGISGAAGYCLIWVRLTPGAWASNMLRCDLSSLS